jgi:cell division initiation protein
LSISPLDVRNQIFKKKLRGYDADEVKIFLDAVADRMEDMIRERENLEQENAALREKANTFADLEATLRDTMVTAQKISDEARVNALKEADTLRRQASLDAQAKFDEARKKVEDVVRAHEHTRAQTMAFISKLRSLLEGHLSFLGSIESEVRSENKIRSEVRSENKIEDRGVEVQEGVQS